MKRFTVVFIIGIVLGSVVAVLVPQSDLLVSPNLCTDKISLFQTSYINIMKLILCIFLVGLIKKSLYYLDFIVLSKGFLFSIAIATFTRIYGVGGFYFSFCLLFPHHLVLIPIIFFAVLIAKNRYSMTFLQYVLALVIISALVSLPSFIDAFVTSILVSRGYIWIS